MGFEIAALLEKCLPRRWSRPSFAARRAAALHEGLSPPPLVRHASHSQTEAVNPPEIGIEQRDIAGNLDREITPLFPGDVSERPLSGEKDKGFSILFLGQWDLNGPTPVI